jgi:hypothetical protein
VLKKEIYPNGLCIQGHAWIGDGEKFSWNVWRGEPDCWDAFFRFYHEKEREGKEYEDIKDEHGIIWINIKGDGVMWEFQSDNIDGEKLAELVEIMGVKMDIFDNRIFGEFKKLKKENDQKENNQQELLKNLGVDCYKEEEFEEMINNLNRKHFLVIHLSLIESLTNERDSEAIKKFWGDYSCVVSNYDFIIVTTGRGRQWLERFKGENTPDDFKEIGKKLRYTPVENLEKCFERGVHLEPYSRAMGIKYALVKALIGS